MAKQLVNIGVSPNTGGDPARIAFEKVNSNNSELYTALGADAVTGALPLALPIGYGGTGATTKEDARTNLGLGTAALLNVEDLPKPLLTTLNDADLTATLDGTGETIVLVNPLTANRVITLPTVGKYNGAKMRVVRQVGSTGAFTVNVGSLKNLSTGQWCDVECNSALNWVLTAFGSL